nr:acyltransferase [uncultured Catonella sp.]
MELKKTKQQVMGLAALFIILFHLFPVSRNNDVLNSVVRYVVMTGYIGVDIFFFMTGYMAYFSNTDNYFRYIKRKFLNIYPLFIFSCVLFIIMGKLSITKALLTLSGIDFIMNGGGSLLWFIPAIMIFYLLVPFYLKLVRKMNNIQLFLIAITVWILIMLVLENFVGNHSINILLCRLPIILFGMTLAKYEGKWKVSYKFISALLLLMIGIFLTGRFAYMVKVNFLISDIFYIVAIPYVFGIILLTDVIFGKIKSYLLNFLGKISLELYCFQMIFGSLIFGKVIRYVNGGVLAFIIVFAIIAVLSYLINSGRKKM